MKRKAKAYMCETDYNWEFDTANVDLPEFFSTVKSLKKHRSCWKECGIVKVEVTVKLLKNIKKGNL